MIEQFKSYFLKLERLSNAELDRSAEKLVVAENGSIARLIAHIAEMSARKTALELGYKSMYDYCRARLNLSEGAVPARIQVANVARRFPQLLVALAERRISLTVAGLLAPHVNETNVDKLILDCAGRTCKATQEYLIALSPKPVFEPSIRKCPASRTPATPQDRDHTITPKAPEPPLGPTPPKSSPTILQPARPDQYNFRFAADRGFKDKFERLAEVLGVENAQKHMADILEKAIDIALEKKDPKKKLERRQKRDKKRGSSKTKSRSNEISKKDEPTRSRYIASEVSERVHARAGYQCQYQELDGRRCSARTGLEIEHARPFGIFRSHDERFLKLLCARHNALAAERVYGAAFIRRKIDERRAPSAERSSRSDAR